MITSVLPLISTHTQDPVIILFNSSAESLLYTHKKKPNKKKPCKTLHIIVFCNSSLFNFFFKLKKTNPHSLVSVRLVINYHYPVITLSAVFLHNKLNKPLINKSKKKKRRREAGEWTELMVIRHSKIYISHCIYKHYLNLTKHFNRVKAEPLVPRRPWRREIVTQCGNVAMLVQKPTFNVPCS